MFKRARYWSLCLLVLMAAFAVRLYGLDWDGAIGAHPDERYVTGVAERLRASGHLNVFGVAPHFSYGHLPVYLLALVMGHGGGDPLLVGRVLAALFDTGTVALAVALGRRVGGLGCGLLSGALVALSVVHVQQAHFFTVDVVLTFFALGAVVSAVSLAVGGRVRSAWITGVWAGMALGSKFSAALLVIPVGAACAVAPGGRRAHWRRALQVGGTALLTFAITNPYALLSPLTLWTNVSREVAVARGTLEVPYTLQYHGTWPYVYPVTQQLLWGMGIPLGLAAFWGLVWTAWWVAKRDPTKAQWVVLMWVLPYFAFTGALYAKFPRYQLPIVPALIILGVCLISSMRMLRLRGAAVSVCLAGTILHCLVFLHLYGLPHPWQAATEWFYENVPPGSVVAVEQWDHPLPVGGDDIYDLRELPIFREDSGAEGLEKWAAMDAILAEADYVVVASRRGYGALAAWSERYPLTGQYYRRLFDGELGFEPVACFRREPRLGHIEIVDDPTESLPFTLPDVCRPQALTQIRLRLDESYVVYDHPRTIVFRRTGPAD
jgi:4-amino-4-deoxy-L-arabinose transferase-like glycosyltransferase